MGGTLLQSALWTAKDRLLWGSLSGVGDEAFAADPRALLPRDLKPQEKPAVTAPQDHLPPQSSCFCPWDPFLCTQMWGGEVGGGAPHILSVTFPFLLM